jgi:signal transduction histidine kinase
MNEESATIHRDSTFRVTVNRKQMISNNPDIKGSLSVILNLDHRKIAGDSLGLPCPPVDSGKILLKLDQQFGKALAGSGLPVRYQILHLNRDSIFNQGQFMAGTYQDVVSGERYGAALSGYKAYLFQQMAPQIAFSLVLFGCIALAFWFIFQTMRQQQRLSEQKNDFIRNVTHELKTPIATVSVAIEAMQHFDALENPDRTREYLDISRLELSRLSLLVDKVLRMSLFEKGEPELKLERFDFKSLIEDILNSMKLQFEKHGARVGFQTTGTDFSLEGDRLHLASVVYNLLDNALKYSPSKPEIAVGLVQNAGGLTLEVRDHGIGIPEAYRDKIFEKFFRVPSGDIHNVKGHGLGLSYVAGVVSKHRGSISVDSREGAGTCFTINLNTDH